MTTRMLRAGALLALSACCANLAVAQIALNLPEPPDGGYSIPEFMNPGGGSLGGFAGFATVYNGQPIILYDAAWVSQMGGMGSPAFRFLRAHEYAHHRMGHVTAQFTLPPAALPVLGYQSELQADCAAVRVLSAAGDHSAIQAAFQVYAAVLPLQDWGGRPGAAARQQQMQWCLAN